MKQKIWVQHLSDEEKDLIVKMVEEKKSYKSIAEHIGCSYASVSLYARKAGHKKFEKTKSSQILAILDDRDKLPVTEIARKYGTKVSNVCGIIMRHALMEDKK